MKKFLILSVFVFLGSTAYPCSGTYYAGGAGDAGSIHNQFLTNCCKGSRITIYNVETGIGGSFIAGEDGINSSCSGGFSE